MQLNRALVCAILSFFFCNVESRHVIPHKKVERRLNQKNNRGHISHRRLEAEPDIKPPPPVMKKNVKKHKLFISCPGVNGTELFQEEESDILVSNETDSVKEQTTEIASEPSTDTTSIKIQYSIESTQDLKRQVEHSLKEHMFAYVGDRMCPSKQLLAMTTNDHDHPVPETNCTPTVNTNHTCTVYESDYFPTFLTAMDIEDTTKTLKNNLKTYAEEKLFSEVNDGIIAMVVYGEEGGKGIPPASATEGVNGSSSIIAGVVGGAVVLLGVLSLGYYIKTRKGGNT